MKETELKLLTRWSIFIKERFSPIEHFLLILFYFSANALVALNLSKLGYEEVPLKGLLGLFVILFMFFHLRIFDEIKDFKNDRVVHPDRPLARGLIQVTEAKKVVGLLILSELIISAVIGLPAFIAACCVAIYSLIMYKEFFIGSWMRPRLATYALTHTLVACWMALFVFSAATRQYFWLIPKGYAFFVLTNWIIFNVFEFGRKTFGQEEEQELVDSYSKRLGSFRAAGNVVFMAVIAVIIAFIIGVKLQLNFLFFALMTLLFAVILVSSFFYGYSNSASWAKRFRSACSVFILFYNVIIVIGILTKRWMT